MKSWLCFRGVLLPLFFSWFPQKVLKSNITQMWSLPSWGWCATYRWDDRGSDQLQTDAIQHWTFGKMLNSQPTQFISKPAQVREIKRENRYLELPNPTCQTLVSQPRLLKLLLLLRMHAKQWVTWPANSGKFTFAFVYVNKVAWRSRFCLYDKVAECISPASPGRLRNLVCGDDN